jgi:hypothetical protein
MMWTTLIDLISSGESSPNWISLMVRRGHFETAGAPGGMVATVGGVAVRVKAEAEVEERRRAPF